MLIGSIIYSSEFVRGLRRLPNEIIAVAVRKEKFFRANPLHPSLRLHALQGKLKGLWSVSVTGNYRIIFERQTDGEILFISIGKHDIYKSL